MFTLVHGSQSLDPARAFATLSLVMLLTGPVGNLIHAVPLFQTALASVDRIQAFLQLDELHALAGEAEVETSGLSRGHTRSAQDDDGMELQAGNGYAGGLEAQPNTMAYIVLTDVSVHLGTEQKAVLRDITVKMPHSSLTVIFGPVGCGKTTLLRALVGDLSISTGHMQLGFRSEVSGYCAQRPWLPSGTVLSLIVGPNDLDEVWLATVIKACALHIDLVSFCDGIHTVIESGGVSLSGGQRQRLALARALYARHSPLVADDVLSGLDANTSSRVFSEVFGPSGLCKLHNITAVLVTNETRYLNQADQIVVLGADGRVAEQGSPEDLVHIRRYAHAEFMSQGETSVERIGRQVTSRSEPRDALSATHDTQHDLARRSGDVAVYWYYMRSIGWLYGSVLLVTTLITAFGLKFGDVWVQWWSVHSLDLSHGSWIGIYVMLACVALASDGAQIWAFLVWTVPKSSGKLHELLLRAVMRAPYQFFTKTDSGVTLNRYVS